uniref:DUF834 domain-containing protein n=1 Tax=Oryza glumipatula TaxID=40148 RepID=A0A0E0B1T6_9ORYZ
MAGFGQGGGGFTIQGRGDSVPVVSGGAGGGGEAGDGGLEQEAAAAMVAATPAISDAGDWPDDHHWKQGECGGGGGSAWGGLERRCAVQPAAAEQSGDAGRRRRWHPGVGLDGKREGKGIERRRKYGGGKLEVSRRHSFVVRPRASACGRVVRAGWHELGARQQEASQARLASGLLSLAK